MHLNRLKILFMASSLLCFSSTLFASDSLDTIGITLGDPWVGIQYNIFSRLGLELRYSLDPDVKMTSFRGSYDLKQKQSCSFFTGLEYGSISFDYEGISGTGSSITPFLGASYKFNQKLSVSSDIGYSLISLTSGNASLSGPEYTFNIWLTVYPFSHKNANEIKKVEAKIENPEQEKVKTTKGKITVKKSVNKMSK